MRSHGSHSTSTELAIGRHRYTATAGHPPSAAIAIRTEQRLSGVEMRHSHLIFSGANRLFFLEAGTRCENPADRVKTRAERIPAGRSCDRSRHDAHQLTRPLQNATVAIGRFRRESPVGGLCYLGQPVGSRTANGSFQAYSLGRSRQIFPRVKAWRRAMICVTSSG